MIVQGFGNVGSHAAVHPVASSASRTIAVGDHTATCYNPEGFNAHKLQDYVQEQRLDRRLPRRQGDHARGVLRDQGRHLRPRRAREPDRRDRGRRRSRCKLVAEGANGPCNPEGERILLERGIDILPDVLANSGGVTVSYYEWVQNKRSESGRSKRSTSASRRR